MKINFLPRMASLTNKQNEIIRGFLCNVFYSFNLPLLIPTHMTSSEIGLWLTYYLNHNSLSLSTKHPNRQTGICADASMTYGGASLFTQEKTNILQHNFHINTHEQKICFSIFQTECYL